MRFFRFLLPILVAAAGCLTSFASEAADAPHVHVQLMVPGQSLSVGRNQANDAGLYFRLEPGWHIYWKNAGDAGEPPHVRWELPKGITATPLRFAAPKRLPLGPLMDYGYEGEALFPFQFLVENSVPGGQ